jgi:hypothetical protein
MKNIMKQAVGHDDSGSSVLEMPSPADLKSAGQLPVPSAVQMVAGVLKNTPKRSNSVCQTFKRASHPDYLWRKR